MTEQIAPKPEYFAPETELLYILLQVKIGSHRARGWANDSPRSGDEDSRYSPER
ncbi:hypothetical protein Glo7428_0580 [Gloeocapsa sp. PCC 7428]|nr:hypothetical protein Glo7428_0580 [Gloeocapsa sp. PCC 7428]